MKNITKILLTTLCFAIISCEGFLNEEPKGLLTPGNFFKNQDEANLALNGLQTAVSDAGIQEHLGTDIGITGRFAIANGWFASVYDYDPTNTTVRTTWTNAYANIRNANLVIAGAEASNLSEQVKGNTIAQAQFYRAMSYLQLTYIFGDVPYWRDEINIEKVSLLGKTDANIIQKEMIADLQKAIASGYLSTARWNQNNGRPTVWAVRMLKAYYHIWRKEWTEANAELTEITTKSPHELNSDYAHMYRQGNELHNELIFGKEALLGTLNNDTPNQTHYNSTAENANARTAMTQLNVFSRAASLCLRQSFANSYDPKDARKKYNVWESHTLTNGTKAVFNFIYIPKLMRDALPISDPLMKTPDVNNLSGMPWRIFRLSDAYLLLSEAEFMQNGSTAKALAAINKVRARTTLPNYTTMTIQDIRNERGWEMPAEGFWGRKYDLIRWGILESTVKGLPAAETAAKAYSLAITRAQDEARLISNGPDGKFRVFPIPQDDLLKSKDVGGALEQNPLWK